MAITLSPPLLLGEDLFVVEASQTDSFGVWTRRVRSTDRCTFVAGVGGEVLLGRRLSLCSQILSVRFWWFYLEIAIAGAVELVVATIGAGIGVETTSMVVVEAVMEINLPEASFGLVRTMEMPSSLKSGLVSRLLLS